MKVLFIGPYRESTGWGEAARAYIKAIKTSGIPMVCRCFRLGAPLFQLDEEILECENESMDDVSVVIQNLLPHHMQYNGDFKNIGLAHFETIGVENSGWDKHLRLMDEVWSTWYNSYNYKNVFIPTDISEYVDRPLLEVPEINENYAFYFVGENTYRKRLSGVLRAYFQAFEDWEPVTLVIKTSKDGVAPAQVKQEILELAHKISADMGLTRDAKRCPSISVIPERLDRDMLLRLHQSCDCFVTTTFGEAWCMPIVDALGMGSNVIAPDIQGIETIFNATNYCKQYDSLGGHYDHVIGAPKMFKDVLTSKESWYQCNINDIADAMRSEFQNQQFGSEIRNTATPGMVECFSYQEVGRQIKENLLNG